MFAECSTNFNQSAIDIELTETMSDLYSKVWYAVFYRLYISAYIVVYLVAALLVSTFHISYCIISIQNHLQLACHARTHC